MLQRIILVSVLAVASLTLVLVGVGAQSRLRKVTPPAFVKATFDEKGVAICPSGYVYDPGFPPVSACRIKMLKPVNGACPSGYRRQPDGSCALESVRANNGGRLATVLILGGILGSTQVGSDSMCPPAFPIYDKSSNRCKACFQPPKDPSKTCKTPDVNGDCEPKKCG